ARILDDGLNQAGPLSLITPLRADGATHVYHQYTIRVPGDRDTFQQGLTDRGVGSAVYYPTPIHRLRPYLNEHGGLLRDWDLEETDRAAQEVLSLPVYAGLSESELCRVVTAVNNVAGQQ